MFISMQYSRTLVGWQNNRQSSRDWGKNPYNEGHGMDHCYPTTTGLNGFLLIWILLGVWVWVPIHHALSCLLPMPVWTGVRLQPAPMMHLPHPIWNSCWGAAWLKSEGGLFREFSFKGELKPKLTWQYKYISQNISFQPKVFKSLLPSCCFQRKCLMEIEHEIELKIYKTSQNDWWKFQSFIIVVHRYFYQMLGSRRCSDFVWNK